MSSEEVFSYNDQFVHGWHPPDNPRHDIPDPNIPCGPGTLEKYAKPSREFLHEVISNTNSKSVLELGCGDLRWLGEKLPSENYYGIDLHERPTWDERKKQGAKLFIGNIATDDLDQIPDVDLVVARDVFIHLANEVIIASLNLIKKKAPYLVASHWYGQNPLRDTRPGEHYLKEAYAVDLSSSPFDLELLSPPNAFPHQALFKL